MIFLQLINILNEDYDEKNKRVALIFILVFMVYKLIFVQFKDDNMALLITKYAGKNNRYFVMRSDLEKIDTIEIGPTCNYDSRGYDSRFE